MNPDVRYGRIMTPNGLVNGKPGKSNFSAVFLCVFGTQIVIHGHVDMGDVGMYHVTQPSKGFFPGKPGQGLIWNSIGTQELTS